MARVGHKKSKNGCACCKARRVKCDEKRPCSACVRLKVDCSLLHIDPSAAAAAAPPPKPKRRKRARLSPILEQQSFGSYRSMESAVFSLHDLQLMHQWTVSTAACLPAQPATQRFFRERLPRQAMRCPWLLHQMMALSAYHIAHLEPEQREHQVRRASWHQGHALVGFNKALNNVTGENCYSLYLTSGLLMITSFAAFLASPEDERLSPIDAFSGIATQIGGVGALRKVTLGYLSSMFPSQELMPGMTAVKHEMSRVAHIRQKLQTLKAELLQMTPGVAHDPTLPVVVSALDELLDSVTESDGIRIMGTPEARAAFLWPMLVDNKFLALIPARHEGALMVLLYYCLILQLTARDCWFLEGWAEELSTEISSCIVTYPWIEHANWPLTELQRRMEPPQPDMTHEPAPERTQTGPYVRIVPVLSGNI